MNSIVVDSVSKTLGNKQVLSEVSFSIKKNGIFAIIGLNGAGKTTLIKTILGLQKQDSGQIKICNIENNIKESRAQVAYLPESFIPSPKLTGLQFLDISLSLYQIKINMSEIKKLAKEMEFDVGYLDLNCSTYSKGTKQKLGLMSCLLSNKKILILDELTTGLDPCSRKTIRSVLKKYSNNKSIFFSSHMLVDIEDLCSEIIILHNGKILPSSVKEIKKSTGEKTLESAFLKFVKNK